MNHIIFAGLFLAAFILSFSTPANGVEPRKKILFFSSEDFRLPAMTTTEEAIRSSFSQYPSNQIAFYNEAQDNARIANEKYEKEYVEFLRRKYDGENIDLIFVRSPPGVRFLLRHESELFTGVPKIFITNDQRELADLNLGSNYTGVYGKIEFATTMDLILKQHVGTSKVVVVTGSSVQDEAYLEQVKSDFSRYAGRVEIAYLSKLTIPDLEKELASLPSDNVCLFVSYGRDPSGNGYSQLETISMLAPTSNVPIYALTDAALGSGTVGGDMLSVQLMGEEAGKIGLRILSGEKPSDIPPQTVESVPMFDWRQLQRWNINEQTLPANSVVSFKELTVWEEFRWHIIGIGAFSIFETLLIGWLLFIRARRKKAEIESRRFASLAHAEHQKLEDVVANVPGIVWESRIEPGTGDRRIEFISEHAEEMLGYTAEEILSVPNFWATVVFSEDQDAVFHATQETLSGGRTGPQQFRCRKKDGAIIWVDAHLAPTHDDTGKVIGLRGVAIDVTDRKIAENELHYREMELREAQRVSQTGNWEWTPETDTVRWSEELYRIAGIDPALPAVTFADHAKLYTPESFERLAAAVSEAMKTGEPYELELQMIRADGRQIWVRGRGEAILDSKSNVIKLRGTLQNITSRKKAEEALIESEARYRNVVETQTELICRYLPDTTLTFVNDAYCRHFGKSREELIGTKFVDLIPPHARDFTLSHIASLIEQPRSETYQHEVILADGSRGWQQWTDSPVETHNGNPPELQGIGRDITEKRHTEDALRASETRFRIMADSAPVLIWMCGPDKLCTYVNQGWLDFTGRTLAQELGAGWEESVYPEDLDPTIKTMDSGFDIRQPFRLEYRLRRADGVYCWVYNSGTPRFSEDGEFLGYIGSCVDISDRKEAEEKAKKAHEEVIRLQRQLQEENIYLKEVIKLEHNFEEIIGHSDPLKYVLFKIEQVAPTDATVLIYGETGTGKELVARAVHSTSLRKNKPLVTVNCASLSTNLIESELFGHERGAFTGAAGRKIGRFELADGATLFLDEIGELPLELQPKLLRVIQEGEFERLGSSKTLKTDVRIIAATNRDLEAEVRRGRFREDLLFRLNVFPITVPPLRERKDDIPELIEYFTSRFTKKIGKNIRSISPATIRRLCEHKWPGNVRELANVIERSVINSQTESLNVTEIVGPPAAENEVSLSDTLEMIERRHIVQILELTHWKIEGNNGAARILGLNPSTLRTRMSRLGIFKDRPHKETRPVDS